MQFRISTLVALLLASCLASASVFAAEGEAKTPADTFKMFDTNEDGFISPEEAEADDDLTTSFEDGDDNDDGQLSLEEFIKMEIFDE